MNAGRGFPATPLFLIAPLFYAIASKAGCSSIGRMKSTLPLVALSLILSVSSFAETPVEKKPASSETKTAGEPKDVTPDEAEKLIKEKKAVVLDIRTPEEFAKGHIEGAINVDFLDDKFSEELAKLDKSTPVIVHCGSGKRSTSSLPQLKEQKFQSIFHLNQGFKAWLDAGKPVKK